MDCGKAQTMMDLSDDRWLELKGGHRTHSDPRPLVAKLEAEQDVENSWHELWGEPCPQGDLGEASYASLPHVVRMYRNHPTYRWDTYAIVAIVERARGGQNPAAACGWVFRSNPGTR